MSRQLQHSSLLNALGLLSAGILIATPAIAQANAAKQNANISQTPTVPTAPTVPVMPKVPTIPATPGTPSVMPSSLPTEPKATDLAPESVAKPAAATTTIVDIASGNSSFKTLTAALKAADLTTALSGDGPFTVFAPTDAAFAALPKGTLEMLLKPENKSKLVKILTYHVVPGNILAADLKTGNVKSLEGSEIKVKVSPTGAVMVNNAKVAIADVQASNGVIHAIDKVILPVDTKSAVKPGYSKPKNDKSKVTPRTTEPTTTEPVK